ncbi:MAG: amidohydrolase family protein [Rhodobiaceae bacterium]|nr:amidohydrolase family protein [Rhodobiaceae bacterium]
MVDLVIRNGRVFDGTGEPPVMADVAVTNGIITAVGTVPDTGVEEIDATGHIVTPGFVDVHTHFDGQATWESEMAPSSWHGITTAVMGNCGVGFAPVRTKDHDALVRLMEGVEDIPGAALHEGLAWDWETFLEYIEALERVPHDIDLATQVPHGALRVYVMGERGANREAATADEISQMARITAEAVEAGALGFATTRTLVHRTSTGDLTPTIGAADEEMIAIAKAIGETGKGILQVVSDFKDIDHEFSLMRAMVRESNCPMTVSIVQADFVPGRWQELLDRCQAALDDGLNIRGQVCGRPVCTLLSLNGSLHPFLTHPSYLPIADKPLAERVAIMRDPAFRKKLLSEECMKGLTLLEYMCTAYHKMFKLGDPPNYEPTREQSLAAIAERQGQDPAEMLYDWLLEKDGEELLLFPLHNYTEFSLDNCRTMMTHPATIMGLADGGAHVGTICDGSMPTTILEYWTRDRTRGERLDLSWSIKELSRTPAEAMGLYDRGLVKVGYKADLNVIDYDNLKIRVPEMYFDLPTGARRLKQKADGYKVTICNGKVIYRDGEATGVLPGQIIRGPKAAPVAAA